MSTKPCRDISSDTTCSNMKIYCESNENIRRECAKTCGECEGSYVQLSCFFFFASLIAKKHCCVCWINIFRMVVIGHLSPCLKIKRFTGLQYGLYTSYATLSSSISILVYSILYHAIENTANQNTGKPLYIPRYSTQPSHRALRSYSRRNLISVFSMASCPIPHLGARN